MRGRGQLGLEGAVFAAGVVLLVFLPHWLGGFRVTQMATVGVYFIAIMGLNILTGYTGQISLGHGGFMMIGAYTTAILVGHHSMRDLWTIPLAGLVAGGAGLLFGLPATRLSGLYLALATFAFASAVPALLKKFSHFTGGSQGIQLFGRPNYTSKGYQHVHVLGRALSFEDWIYYLTWAVAVVLFVIAWVLLRGRTGRTFRAIRDSEIAATSSGVNLPFYKTFAFGISAFYAGVAGSLFALVTTFVSPSIGQGPVLLSLYLLIGAAVSGVGSLWGVALGALFVQYLPDLSNQISTSSGASDVVRGVILILVLVLMPTGAAGLAKRVGSLTNWLFRRS